MSWLETFPTSSWKVFEQKLIKHFWKHMPRVGHKPPSHSNASCDCSANLRWCVEYQYAILHGLSAYPKTSHGAPLFWSCAKGPGSQLCSPLQTFHKPRQSSPRSLQHPGPLDLHSESLPCLLDFGTGKGFEFGCLNKHVHTKTNYAA